MKEKILSRKKKTQARLTELVLELYEEKSEIQILESLNDTFMKTDAVVLDSMVNDIDCTRTNNFIISLRIGEFPFSGDLHDMALVELVSSKRERYFELARETEIIGLGRLDRIIAMYDKYFTAMLNICTLKEMLLSVDS